jgi:hypothetical protein
MGLIDMLTKFKLNLFDMKKQSPGAGHQRFLKQMDYLSAQLALTRKADDPALALYTTGARTPLFMLESLARIYRTLHNKKTFGKLYDDFKLAEDMLGAIDYYDAFYKEFKTNKSFPEPLLRHFAKSRDTAAIVMGKMLKIEKWISKKQKKVKKINSRLERIDWLPPEEETPAIAGFIISEVQAIKNSLQSGKLAFNDIEAGVHELRRKLRWISIYTTSLNGLIQLEPQKTVPSSLKKYVTPDVVKSPFNQLPARKKGVVTIKINANTFYTLSWIIAKLGDLKDRGLKVHAVAEALKITGTAKGEAADKKALVLCGEKKLKIADLLAEAEKITHDLVFKHHVLDKLENDLSRYM